MSIDSCRLLALKNLVIKNYGVYYPKIHCSPHFFLKSHQLEFWVRYFPSRVTTVSTNCLLSASRGMILSTYKSGPDLYQAIESATGDDFIDVQIGSRSLPATIESATPE
jgi:hypothetical protein